MTEAQQEKLEPKKNLIPPSFSQAFLAGVVTLSASYVFGVPAEYAVRVAVAGASYSVFLSWRDSRLQTSHIPYIRGGGPRKSGRQIPFNHSKGQSKIDMEFSVAQGGYITRKGWREILSRWVYGKPKLKIREIESVDKPDILNEFIFISHYKGQIIELRERHIRLFLKDAWKNRSHGKGFSCRRWGRDRAKRPVWFQELPTVWYFGMSMLLWDAQKSLGIQLVVRTGYQWHALAIEPRELYCCLRWHEYNKRRKKV